MRGTQRCNKPCDLGCFWIESHSWSRVDGRTSEQVEVEVDEAGGQGTKGQWWMVVVVKGRSGSCGQRSSTTAGPQRSSKRGLYPMGRTAAGQLVSCSLVSSLVHVPRIPSSSLEISQRRHFHPQRYIQATDLSPSMPPPKPFVFPAQPPLYRTLPRTV